ncbi:ABC transporter permease, partial [Streptomyces sp. TRM76130]|nr:ABC transporter permease [Streptomyces sp. TRM76130]
MSTDPDGRPPPPAREGVWTRWRGGPWWPASVLVLILAAAAGLFAGSYTYTMADPTPRQLPTAVVGSYEEG